MTELCNGAGEQMTEIRRGFLMSGHEHFDGEEVFIRSPWDQSVVGVVWQASRTGALEAVRLLEQSFAVTRQLASHERKRVLLEVAEKIAAQKDDLARMIVAEAGKPLKAARVEVERAVLTFTTAGEESVRMGGEVLPLDLLKGNEGRWGMVAISGWSGACDYTVQFSAESGGAQAGSGGGGGLSGTGKACSADAVLRAEARGFSTGGWLASRGDCGDAALK